MFHKFDFKKMSEADVREEIIAPLLRYLGYRSGTLHNVVREQHLSYPQLSLGRRKSTDPYLKGVADYICEAGGVVRWVIEAKAPGLLLDPLVAEQAWSYANHQEVRAVYFAVTNGQSFKVYQTNRGSGAAPVFECSYQEMSQKLTTIENLLSPAAILRDHPIQELDIGSPIGPGLRSIVRITRGQITYTKISVPIPALHQMIMTVESGSVERKEDGSLVAYLCTLVPFRSLQELNQKIGLDALTLTSTSASISTDPCSPTIFLSERRAILSQGTPVLNLMDWSEVVLPANVSALVRTSAIGHLNGRLFEGRFFASISYVELAIQVVVEGLFKLHLT